MLEILGAIFLALIGIAVFCGLFLVFSEIALRVFAGSVALVTAIATVWLLVAGLMSLAAGPAGIFALFGAWLMASVTALVSKMSFAAATA